MNKEDTKIQKPSKAVESEIRRRTFISYAIFAGLATLGYSGWKWLRNSPSEQRGLTAGAKSPFRRVLNQNEQVAKQVFSHKHLTKTYPKSRAANIVRKNGNLGLKGEFIEKDWNLNVKRASGQVLEISMSQLKALPKTELIFDFKCVEGWNQIQHWGGVRFIDFMDHFKLTNEAAMEYVGFQTPDSKYYVGMDMESAIHPQTILAYEMNDEPLVRIHGAPLRLIVPVKYGIKNLKCIGTINFSKERPRDYWAERGYDYYAGL